METAILGVGEHNVVVQAGAGTGKTHALLTIALQLLAGARGRRTPPSRLVLLTFTDKAALQLRERLQQRVAAHCAEEPGVWQEIQRELSDATVATFHSFCATQLRRFAREAELEADFTVLDEAEARLLHAEAARAEVLELLDEDDPDARALVEQFGLGGGYAPGLVDLLRAISDRLTEDGRGPGSLDDGRWDDVHWRPLVETAQERLRAALSRLRTRPPRAVLPHLELLDALLVRVADASPDELHDASSDLRKAASGGRGDPLLGELDEALAGLRLALGARDAAPLARAFVALLTRVERRFDRLKSTRNVLDFSDLQRRARLLLLRDVAVRKALKAQFDVLLVDELQDTNRVQQDLVALLGEVAGRERELPVDGPLPPPDWEPGRTIVVGDRKQSIYAFRGAELAGVARLEQSLLHPPDPRHAAQLVQLRRSYRARPGIVSLTNALSERLFPTEESLALEPVRAEAPVAWPAEFLSSVGPDAASQREDEARRIAARISNLLWNEQDPVRVQSTDGTWRRALPRDVVVLLRRLTTVDVYRQALASQGIPHAVVGGGSFYERLEISDAWALLAVIIDPTDAFASAALLRSSWCALGDATLTLLSVGEVGRVRPRGLAIARLLTDRPKLEDERETARLELLLTFVAAMSRKLDLLGSAEVLALALEQLDYLAVASEEPDPDAIAANLGKLEEQLRRWERAASPREAVRQLGERLRQAPREPEALPFDEDAPTGVRLMTVHQAKGLEFPVVFVADCGASEARDTDRVAYDPSLGLGLSVRREDDTLVADPHLERIRHEQRERTRAESQRLLYVAATRARDHLVFSGSARAGSWTTVLDALPPMLLRRAEAMAPVPAPPRIDTQPPQQSNALPAPAARCVTRSLDALVGHASSAWQPFPWRLRVALQGGATFVIDGAVESITCTDGVVEVVARVATQERAHPDERALRLRTLGLAARESAVDRPQSVRVALAADGAEPRFVALSDEELDAQLDDLRALGERLLRER